MKLLTMLVTMTLLAVTLAAPARAQLTIDPLMAQFLAQEPVASPALVKARQHFFGAENVNPKTGRVNPDKVILSWFSVSSLAAALRGHVVLLDTYIDSREDYPNRVPTTLNELVALQPEFIFIGHGHFDHADTAGYIAAVTGTTVVGTPEHCAQAQRDATNTLGPGATVNCVAVVSANSAPGSEVKELALLDNVCITAFKHLHSAAVAPDPSHPVNPPLLLPDPGTYLLHPPGPGPSDGVGSAGNEGWSMFYQFRIADFALSWHDTVGPLKENAPQVFDVLRALAPTDVQAGAILGFNVFTNGLRDPAMYIAAVEPKIFAPLHHDFRFVTPEASGDDWKATMDRELVTMSLDRRPELRWLYDPFDYLRPGLMTFDVKAPYWKTGDVAGRAPETCKR